MNSVENSNGNLTTASWDSMDYELLRKEGVAYIQRIAGQIWTDYNVHDPGVTILELLCYALSDLAYRTNFNIADMLAPDPALPDAKKDPHFFTARQIMTCNPVTMNDYRKLLIDTDGIKNAWLNTNPLLTPAIYADPTKLTYTDNDNELVISGLYGVQLELDADDELGDLNDNTLFSTARVQRGKLEGLTVEVLVQFPYWDQPGTNKIKSLKLNVIHPVQGYEVSFTMNGSTEFIPKVVDRSGEDPAENSRLANTLKGLINKEIAKIIVRQKQKTEVIISTVDRAKKRLNTHRNLCEDFIHFESLRAEEIIICTTIELTPETVIEEAEATIYDLISRFLAPDTRFYSVEELLNKGKRSDEIFEGPRLRNGFIDDEELINSQQKTAIRVSDLVNIIMDVPGVIAIQAIETGKLDNPSDFSDSWVIKITGGSVPRLNTERSKLLFSKKGIPFSGNKDKVNRLLDQKQKQRRSENHAPTLDLPVPSGKYRNLGSYTSIQEEFPLNYGIGEVGLPDSAPPLRKAQAKQLKGFLLFFDQILANYCSQLGHVGELLSADRGVNRTYFTQTLREIPDIALLYEDFGGDHDRFDQMLQAIVESPQVFEQRRNGFLDHLLARFCEQFTDYVLLSYHVNGPKASRDLIDDKLAFIREYPEISSGRGKAFDYSAQDWNTNNVSGLEKRIARLLGIPRYKRRDLVDPEPVDFFQLTGSGDELYFELRDESNNLLLKSQMYTSESDRKTGMASTVKNGTDPDSYQLTPSNGRFFLDIRADNYEIVASGPEEGYATEDEGASAIRRIIEVFTNEGFYLIEHLLLRPRRKNGDHFLPISPEECGCTGAYDPYSFRATCVLPYWTGRFMNMDFRHFVERTIREEAPAHLHIKICWVSEQHMKELQAAYKNWLNVLSVANADHGSIQLTNRQNELIAVLKKLRTVYPTSYLYDCKETERPPMRLDRSELGTFTPTKNEE